MLLRAAAQFTITTKGHPFGKDILDGVDNIGLLRMVKDDPLGGKGNQGAEEQILIF